MTKKDFFLGLKALFFQITGLLCLRKPCYEASKHDFYKEQAKYVKERLVIRPQSMILPKNRLNMSKKDL